jgi:hypothetical protein
MPAKMAQISPLGRRSGCQDLRPPSAPPGGFVKTRQQRKNPPRFGVHLGNPGLICSEPGLRANTLSKRSGSNTLTMLNSSRPNPAPMTITAPEK